jgi:signal transduction histidine kinase
VLIVNERGELVGFSTAPEGAALSARGLFSGSGRTDKAAAALRLRSGQAPRRPAPANATRVVRNINCATELLTLLKQVWLNLLSNAFKYTRRREPAVIEVGCMREKAPARRTRLG